MRTNFLMVVATLAFATPGFAQDAAPGNTAPPTTAAPGEVPPMPSTPPTPPSNPEQQEQVQSQAPQQQGAPVYQQPMQPQQSSPGPGQWVYTSQYGWIYVPYAQSYTYVDPAGELAFNYAYYPTYGWQWLPAPWVLGWGPTPYWGTYGFSYYAWHTHPWFHPGIYRANVWARWGGPYGGWHGGGAGWRGGAVAPGYHGGAVAPFRGGGGFARPAYGGGGYHGGAGGFHGGGGGHHR